MVKKEEYRRPLTRREEMVLSLMCQGCSNAEIATILSLHPETIKNYVGQVLRKLNAKNRTHAVVMTINKGTHSRV